MHSLAQPYRKFVRRLELVRHRALHVESQMGKVEPWRIRYYTEGIISDLWQDWCYFTRTVLILSCQGCISRSGTSVLRRKGENSPARIAYEAKQAVGGEPIKIGKILAARRYEPTWGDKERLIDIVTGLKPANESRLIMAFGVPRNGPKHLQLTRNACAHKHNESIAALRSILIYYVSQPFGHPSEFVWQIESQTKTAALYSWIYDMKYIADLATGA